MAAAQDRFARLDGAELTLVFALFEGATADCIYLGTRLPDGEDLSALMKTAKRARHESQPDVPPVPGVLPERKGGWAGTSAVEMLVDGKRAETGFCLVGWDAANSALELRFDDPCTGASLRQYWAIGSRDVVSARSLVSNQGSAPLTLSRCASLALPVPRRFTQMTTYSGRWAGEMREARREIAPDGLARRSAIGKPGFGGGNWVLLHDPLTDEVLGAHLAWSGDHETRVECDTAGAADGRAIMQIGAAWDAGEVVLAPGDDFTSPQAVFSLGSNRDTLAQNFHIHVREDVLPKRSDWGLRKVHLNSWEALGFELSEPALRDLASSAAELGIERFVLDDGWFAGRRDDSTSLGDWTVSPRYIPCRS